MKLTRALPITGLVLALCAGASHAGSVHFSSISAGSLSVKVTSLKEARFRTTVRQQYDFSCGSAALATLLTHHYRRPVNEQEVFTAMYDSGDQGKIRREGFSLLDMKNYLEASGYRADGYSASLERLVKNNTPAIVLINYKGYKHFVVVKGMRDEMVLVGDPSLGSKVIPREQFESMWTNRILFVIRSHRDHTSFNSSQDWRGKVKAPLGEALGRDSLANITLLRYGPNDF